jgi:DNA helicase-2/ATP-dependent DNA helicase PcrA
LLKRCILQDDRDSDRHLVNSAVDNFYNRINGFIHERGLFPNIGYRVRTLHGLAHDIVHERPGCWAGFEISDLMSMKPRSIVTISQAWLKSHPVSSDRI